ncbi:hypothetical protein EWM64_g7497 [Hericium alpestre]|uniref:FAD-binding PCMH-type domain-containing protein n=1 Tax=Hericium alpestre TaxID=135208 RepID=A0A4Y9ZR36_9AGAM|nr:hypothetical protein EWM64_g7497 [Hericium alpestre]
MPTPITSSTFTQLQKAFKGDLVTPEHPNYEDAIKRCTVRVDEEKKLAYIGGGALWETVDKTAIQYGLATTAGTINHTGVGGLTLGGGFGYLAAQHGLVIDNLVQATVVIADGTTLTASSEENEDLFWAIRGGGSNFGVCAEFVLKLHPQRRTVFAGAVTFPPHALEQLTAVLADKFKRGLGEKETLFELLTLGPDGKNDKFYHGGNYYMKHVYQPAPDFATAQKITDHLTDFATQHDIKILFLHEFWGNKICSVPVGAMAFNRIRDLGCLIVVTYKDNTEEGLEVARMVAKELANIASGTLEDGRPGSEKIGYSGFTSEIMTTAQSKALFGDNYKRMQVLKKKYDPDMVFSKWYSIVPAA